MFPDANNHSLPDTRKGNIYSSGTGNMTRYLYIYMYIYYTYICIYIMYAVYAERLFLLNTLMSVKTRFVFSTSASQYPIMLLVITRIFNS